MSRLTRVIRKASQRFQQDVVVISTMAAPPADAQDEETYHAGTETRTLQKALVTYAESCRMEVQQFLEAAHADIVLDFFPEADLSGDSVKFLINGEIYAQKSVGKELAQYFTRAGRETFFRTVLGEATNQREGVIRYVSSVESMDLYHGNLATGAWSWVNTDALAGRAEVRVNNLTTRRLEIAIQDAVALAVDSDGWLRVGLLATGRNDGGQLPRLEFYSGQVQVATLSKTGVLTVRRRETATTDPGRRADMAFRDAQGAWLFSFSDHALRVPGVRLFADMVDGVRFVSADGSADLYFYNGTAFEALAGARIPQHAEIFGEGNGRLFRMEIQGIVALAVDLDGTLLCKSFNGTGVFSSELPRLEFVAGGTVFATLTPDGRFSASRFMQAPAPDTAWLDLFDKSGAYAARISDTL